MGNGFQDCIVLPFHVGKPYNMQGMMTNDNRGIHAVNDAVPWNRRERTVNQEAS